MLGRRWVRTLALLAPLACIEGAGGLRPGFEIVFAETVLSFLRGEDINVQFDITRRDFTGDVTLSMSGLPTGVTAAFSENPVTNNTLSVTATLTAALTASIGTTEVELHAAAEGQTTRSHSFDITILEPPGFAIAVLPPLVSINHTATSTANVTLTRVGGFAGPINLSATGLAEGITATFDPTSVTGTSSIVTFSALGISTLGTSTTTIVASASGVPSSPDHSFQLDIVVLPQPSIAMEASVDQLSLTQGQGAQLDLTFTRTNFDGPLNLSATGLPAGVTAEFSVNPVPFNIPIVTASFVATGTAVLGTTQVDLSASAAGITAQTVSFDLTVNQAPGFEMILDPSAVTVARNATSTTTLTINRVGGFNAPVTLSAVDLPNGVTVTFDPIEVIGTSSQASFSALDIASTATSTMSIIGSTPGLADRILAVDVTVIVADPCATQIPFPYGSSVNNGTLDAGDCDLFPTLPGGMADNYSVTTTQSANLVSFLASSSSSFRFRDGTAFTDHIFSFGSTATRKVFLPVGTYLGRAEANTGSDVARTYTLAIGPTTTDLSGCVAGQAPLVRPFPAPGLMFTQMLETTDCFGVNWRSPGSGDSYRDPMVLSLLNGESVTITMESEAFQPIVRLVHSGPGGTVVHTGVGSCDPPGPSTTLCRSVLGLVASANGQYQLEFNSSGLTNGPILGAYSATILKNP